LACEDKEETMAVLVSILDGGLALARITYLCDLQCSSGKQIPLGVIAEITVGPLRGLGLIGRTELRTDEIESIGLLMRDQLRAPFDFLKTQFDWAWANTKPGAALGELAARHSESLFFTPPKRQMIRRAFQSEPDITEYARRQLRDMRDQEYDLMLAELWGSQDPSTEDLSRLAA
jgi:hypothetical protein